MSIHSIAKQYPATRRSPRLTIESGQTRRLLLDASQDARVSHWCRTRRRERCTLGGCDSCPTAGGKLHGQISFSLDASVHDPIGGRWHEVLWNVSNTTMQTIAKAIPAGVTDCTIDVTRTGSGFDTVYTVAMVDLLLLPEPLAPASANDADTDAPDDLDLNQDGFIDD